ncbi:hypothetical protein [Noviherbaspirillum aerium]|uniref:hypothetical protein n=1 Tax=Noviherbaspirillum aerium TaxID=2588497 RepID=UPI00124CA99A|nr:hypothetical protein [Noviherbaspirillum aerium]
MTFDTQIAGAILWIIAVLLMAAKRKKNVIATTQKGAEEALANISEWSKWMSGIQTAAIGGLALLVMNEDEARFHPLPEAASFFALAAFGLLGAALFFNAWVLSSMPSHSIRVHVDFPDPSRSPDYDVYEQPLYGWSKQVRLGYVLNAKHWLWAHGLLAVGLFFITLMYCNTQCR